MHSRFVCLEACPLLLHRLYRGVFTAAAAMSFSNHALTGTDHIPRHRFNMVQDLPVLLARELIPQVPDEVLIHDNEEGSSSSAPSSPTSSCSEYSPP